MDIVLTFQLVVAIVIALFVAYNVFHYVLFLLVTQPKDASTIGHELNQFEQRQLIEWTPQPSDFLKHDDEKRTYDDVFGTYRDEQAVQAQNQASKGRELSTLASLRALWARTSEPAWARRARG